MDTGRKLSPDQGHFPGWELRAKQGKGKDRDEEAEDKETETQRNRQRQKAKGEASSMAVVLMSHQYLSGTEPIRSREAQESGRSQSGHTSCHAQPSRAEDR